MNALPGNQLRGIVINQTAVNFFNRMQSIKLRTSFMYYVDLQGVSKKVDPFKFKLFAMYCINLTALNALN